MSRDWTPAEHYLVEQRHIKEGHGDLFDFLENLKIVYDDGREVVVNPPEEMAIRCQFPMLGRLLMDDFMELYSRLNSIPGGVDFLHRKDEELADIVRTLEARKKVADKKSYLFKWFIGELDNNFYYGERNNQLFVESMVLEAQSLNREEYNSEKFEAALKRFSHDVDIDANLDHFKSHANKLIYCYENKKDLIDFDFWVRYELLLGEKLAWDEYVAIDNKFDGDPHDVELSNKRTINTFRTSLKRFRNAHGEKPSLEDNVRDANDRKVKLQSGDCRGVGDISIERD